MELDRRRFTALAGLAAFSCALPGTTLAQNGATQRSEFRGVRLGTCLYNFRSIPRGEDQQAYLGGFIDACRAVGVDLVEINAPYLEPPSRLPFAGIPRIWDAPLTGGQRESFERLTAAEVEQERRELREWRMSTSPTYFAAFAERLRQASLQPFSYVMTFTPDMTDAEIEAIFGHAKGLGVNVFSTNQTKVEMASRLAPFADRYFVDIGFHNHTATGNPNEAASRTSLERILSVSRRMMVNLDVGHYVASNQDVMAFARDHFDRISHFHMKDRKRNEGPGVPFGEGDAPIAELLTLLHERRSAKPAIVEYEYLGTGSAVEETTRSIAYLKALLEKIAASEH